MNPTPKPIQIEPEYNLTTSEFERRKKHSAATNLSGGVESRHAATKGCLTDDSSNTSRREDSGSSAPPAQLPDYTTRKGYQQNYAKNNRATINQRKRAWRAARKVIMNETPHTEVETLPMRHALSREQIEILDHTIKRAANQHYCGGGKDMAVLVSKGFMRSLGFKSFVPDEYFTITSDGREALRLSRCDEATTASGNPKTE